jgi:hypothetical protein
MIVTRKALPRRTVLRGLGATIALPLLDCMVPAFAAVRNSAARPTKRLSVVYVPMGAVMDHFTPATEGSGFELPAILQPLARVQDQLVVVTGLDNEPAVALPGEPAGGHGRIGAAFLTGVHGKPTEGADFRAGVSVDQIAAGELGKETQLRSLEIGLEATDLAGACDVGYSCAYVNTLCWRTPTTPLPMENNPRAVFERLFGDADTTDPAAQAARLRKNRSILDSVVDKVADRQAVLGARDRVKLTQYLDAIRDVELRIQKAEAQADRELPTLERPTGSIPETFEEYAKVMFDLLVLAYQADLTRVGTFMIGKEISGRTYREIGVAEGHHQVTHSTADPERIAKLVRINTFHMQLFAAYLERLKETPDGDGSLLDHMMVFYGSGMSESDQHDPHKLPVLLVGGGAGQLKGGRHLRYRDGTPLTNLYLTMVHKLGVPAERVGNSTGVFAELSGL